MFRTRLSLLLLAAFIGWLPYARASLPVLRGGLPDTRASEAAHTWQLAEIHPFSTTDDELTPAVSYVLDRRGWLQSTTDAAGTLAFEYEHGILLGETRTGGPLAGYSIVRRPDALHRVDRLTLKHDGAPVHQVDFGFDDASRLHTVTRGPHVVTHNRNPADELRLTQSFKNGAADILTVEHRFDRLERLSSRASLPNGHAPRSFAHTHNLLNQRTRAERPDGTREDWVHDFRGQLAQSTRSDAGETPFPGLDFGYSFDDIGNRLHTTTNGRVAAYTHNDANEITSRVAPRALDARGEAHPAAAVTVDGQPALRLGEYFHHAADLTAAGDGPHVAEVTVTAILPDGGFQDTPRIADATLKAFLPQTPEPYTHDQEGNLLSDGRWDYTWDAHNRLHAMETRPAAWQAGVPRQRLEFAYDYMGRRFQKQVQDWNLDLGIFEPTKTILYHYDGWLLIREYLHPADGPATTRTHIWGNDLSGTKQGGGGVGGLLMTVLDDGSVHYPVMDGNGNIVAYINAADGSTSAQYEHGPFGEPLQADGPLHEKFPHRFSTKYVDLETGFLYYGHRYYNPETGRWLSRDPIGEDGGLNLYGFVGNDPVNFIDFLGLAKGKPPPKAHYSQGYVPLEWHAAHGNAVRARADLQHSLQSLTEAILQGHSKTVQDQWVSRAQAALAKSREHFIIDGTPRSYRDAAASMNRHSNKMLSMSNDIQVLLGKRPCVFLTMRQSTIQRGMRYNPATNQHTYFDFATKTTYKVAFDGTGKVDVARTFEQPVQLPFMFQRFSENPNRRPVTRQQRWIQLAEEGNLPKQLVDFIHTHGGEGVYKTFGIELAHPPGRPASQGFDYSEAIPKTAPDHRGIQHRYLIERSTGTTISLEPKPRTGGALDLPPEGALP